MSNINKELEKILSARYGKDVRQAIHDSIKEIDSVASTAQNSASNSAKSALASETSAKASMEAAANSEALAEQYKNEAFAGTPEGYSALVEQVGLLDIATSTGNTLYNSKKGGYRLNDLVGNTVQNGEPTPSTPIAIENTFDCVEMIQGTRANTGIITNNSLWVASKHFISCNSGDLIELIYEKVTTTLRVSVFTSEYEFIKWISAEETKTLTATIPSGASYFAVEVADINGITPQTVGKITLTVNGKYVGQIARYNKNKIVLSECTNQFVNSSLSVSNNSEYVLSKLFEIGEYVVSWGSGTTGYTVYFVYYDENKNITSRVPIMTTGKSFALADITKGAYFRVMYANSLATEYARDVQLEKGKVVTPYEEGKCEVTTFFLNEPLRATDRVVNVDRVFNENHKRSKVVLNGTESIGLASSVGKQFTFGIPNCGGRNLICTHFRPMEIATWDNLSDMCLSTHPSEYDSIRFRYDDCSTVDEFKSYLATQYANGTPIEIEYTLAEETYTPLDIASQLALNSLETFDGVTYIEVDSKVKPTSISGEYGTSQVGAYTLKCMNDNDTDRVERAEMKTQIETLRNMILSLGGNV